MTQHDISTTSNNAAQVQDAPARKVNNTPLAPIENVIRAKPFLFFHA